MAKLKNIPEPLFRAAKVAIKLDRLNDGLPVEMRAVATVVRDLELKPASRHERGLFLAARLGIYLADFSPFELADRLAKDAASIVAASADKSKAGRVRYRKVLAELCHRIYFCDVGRTLELIKST